MEHIDLEAVRDFLLKNEEFLMRLVENPMIFEHESFTDLILAISHLTEELKARGSLVRAPEGRSGPPCHRLPAGLSCSSSPNGCRYMEYLRNHYPYLFNLAMRKNPFDTAASVVIGREDQA